MENNYPQPSSSEISYADLQSIQVPGEYGDYQRHDIDSLLCRVNWVSDTLDYLRRNPKAELINLPEISRYASQLFAEMLNQQSANPNKKALARRLNNLLGLLVETTARSGQLVHSVVEQDKNYNQAKYLATLLDPYDQLTAWGNQLTVFEAISSNYGNEEQDLITKNALNPDRYNYMPAVLEDFCSKILFYKDQVPESSYKKRILKIYDIFQRNGFTVKGNEAELFIVRESDKRMIKPLTSGHRSLVSHNLGELAISRPDLKLVA